MKKLIYLVPALLMASCGGGSKTEKAELKTDKQKASYALGINQAQRLEAEMQQGGVDSNAFEMGIIIEGMKDYFDKKPRLTEEEMRSVIMRYLDKIQEEKVSEFKKQNEPKKAAAEKYMAENAGKKGVITTESGLQYEVIKEGKGPLIQLNDSISVFYNGTYTDGSVFDGNIGQEPYAFRLTAVGSVIQGWVEALQLMKKGSKFKLTIPYDLAYGDMGMPPRGPGDQGILPYSVLIFDLEIVNHVPAGK